MKKISLMKGIRIFGRGIRNYFVIDKPIVVSYEVTHSCTANCLHCDKGGIKKEENLLVPSAYKLLTEALHPIAVQISGGEPLLRTDVVDIVREVKRPYRLPLIIFVTNGSLLNEDNYLLLKEAGVDSFSVSLDFPNEKHDDFRRLPGLYAHLEETIPRLAANFGSHDIELNTAITRLNLPYLVALAQKADEWDVSISYSAYCTLRTGDKDLFIRSEDDLEMLQEKIHELLQFKKEKGRILNSTYNLMKTYEFFKSGYIPNCQAGKRFLVVEPRGGLTPCSMQTTRQYSTQEEILEDFTKQNKCGECYVAIRAYSDKSARTLLKDSISFFLSNRSNRRK